jgi:hypothetical protein
VDASTYNRRNLTSTDAVFSLFESIARNLDMTLVIPPIVCRYPFANSELETFCDDVEQELKKKIAELGEDARPDLDLNLTPVAVMRQSLKKRQMEDSGVTGVSGPRATARSTPGTRTITSPSTRSPAPTTTRPTPSGCCSTRSTSRC